MNGKTLVICCEGNAGFYEIGIMSMPIEAGYSVLGWNHPGFYGSTGDPYPYQETQASDAVMQFAIHKLGFHPENILVTGWSIGGYSATWLAMNYPDVKGVVRDYLAIDVIIEHCYWYSSCDRFLMPLLTILFLLPYLACRASCPVW